jgi:hypothetical protein
MKKWILRDALARQEAAAPAPLPHRKGQTPRSICAAGFGPPKLCNFRVLAVSVSLQLGLLAESLAHHPRQAQ